MQGPEDFCVLGHSAAKQQPPGHGLPGGLLVGGRHGPGRPVGWLRGPLSRSRIEQREEGRPQEAYSGLSMGAAAPSPRSSPDSHTQKPRAPCPPTMGQPSLGTGPPPSTRPLHGAQGSQRPKPGCGYGPKTVLPLTPTPLPARTHAHTHAVLLGLTPLGQGQQTWTPLWDHRRPPTSKRKLFRHINQRS